MSSVRSWIAKKLSPDGKSHPTLSAAGDTSSKRNFWSPSEMVLLSEKMERTCPIELQSWAQTLL